MSTHDANPFDGEPDRPEEREHQADPVRDEDLDLDDEELDLDDDVELDEQLVAETDTLMDALFSHALSVRGSDLSLTRRVTDRADAIAHQLGLDARQRELIRKAAALRDVGKPGVPEEILTKAGPLTRQEFEEVQHRMVPQQDVEDSESVQAAIEIAHHHHEKFDGSGYPDHLSGEQIPIESRVLSAAEAYETMMVDAAWRPARSPEKALEEVRASAGTQFDPRVVEALERTVETGQPGWRARRLSRERPDYWGKR